MSGLVSGSTGLVVQDGATDNLLITANGPFTFKTQIANGQPYTVFVSTQPGSPAQTCTVSNGSGTATANVTNIQVICSTGGTGSIGGTVVGLSGIGLSLQDNGGDTLAISGNGPFTFKTAVSIGNTYNVTVLTQPNSPTQTCTVTNGSGTAAGSVGNIQITCSFGTISIGGTISGLAKAGSGIVLQDNGGDNLTINANGTFTFPTLLASGATYNATILTQPSGPNQTCTLTNGSGTANSNITNIQITCPAIFHTIGGTVVGLKGHPSQMVLQNNLGDNLTITGNGTFTFNTPIADGSTYDVTMLVGPDTQPGVGVVLWFYQGTATSAITTVIIDCGHNDWAWFDGPSTANNEGNEPAPPPPTSPLTFSTNSPGGRKYPATWTDGADNLWMFGGYGMESPIFTPSPNTAQPLDDMWEYVGAQNPEGSFRNYWTNVAPATLTPPVGTPDPRFGAVTWTQPGAGGALFLFGGQSSSGSFLNDMWKFNPNPGTMTWTQVRLQTTNFGVYGTLGTPAAGNTPGPRWGATGGIDPSGTVWLFGGFGYDSAGVLGLLNDVWNYNITLDQWTWVGGSNLANVTGVYGTQGTPNGTSNFPGGRETAMSWLDTSGNFWVFGGFDLDSNGSPAALNDLWKFKGGVWTWMSGANVINQKGNYGTQGVAAPTNVPGARWSSATWIDNNGNLWLYGGQGYDAVGNGSLADLWEYTGGQWIWTKGPNAVSQSGSYGTTIPGPIIYPYVGNYPGSRLSPGYWIDNTSSWGPVFWIFGGEGFDKSSGNGNGFLSDLWRYLPYPNAPSTN